MVPSLNMLRNFAYQGLFLSSSFPLFLLLYSIFYFYLFFYFIFLNNSNTSILWPRRFSKISTPSLQKVSLKNFRIHLFIFSIFSFFFSFLPSYPPSFPSSQIPLPHQTSLFLLNNRTWRSLRATFCSNF